MARDGKEVVFVEVAPVVKRRLRTAADVLSESRAATVDMSDIVRDAINEKLDRLAEEHPQLQAA